MKIEKQDSEIKLLEHEVYNLYLLRGTEITELITFVKMLHFSQTLTSVL